MNNRIIGYMKVKIGNTIYDSETEPICLIFKDDKSRKTVAEQLTNMEPRDAVRKYCSVPDSMDKEEIYKFMKI